MKQPHAIFGLLLGSVLMAGCVSPGKRVTNPAEATGAILGYVAASPVLIIKGLLEGIAATPHFVDGDLRKTNAALVKAKAPVDLERTYSYAYDANFQDVPADGDTGQVFRDLKQATHHFRKALRGYGIRNANDYLLTAVRTADNQGYTLYAVVHRPEAAIRVKPNGGRVVTVNGNDPAFYQPYATDAKGRPLDIVLDWAAVPRTSIRTQKGQVIMMTIAVNSVRINRRSDDFWAIQESWRRGQYRQITERQRVSLAGRLK